MPYAGKDHGNSGFIGGGNTALSLTDPPGWITALAPASINASRPSAKGKNASDAATDPIVRGCANPCLVAVSCAFCTAIRAESTRLIWPAPLPAVVASLTKTMAFDLTCLITRQANSISLISAFVGGALGNNLQRLGHDGATVTRLCQKPSRH